MSRMAGRLRLREGRSARQTKPEERTCAVEENSTAPLAGRKEWLGLAVLTLPTMLAMLDLNVLFLALPRITSALHPSATQQLWITDIYGFLIAGFLVSMGRLGDRIGRKRLLLIGISAFGVLSVIAAHSANPGMLIAVRALLGIAGATIMPMTLALIRGTFTNSKQMGKAMGFWTMAMMLGISVGPAVGGLLLNSFWWGSVFLIAVPVTVIVLSTGPFLLKESKDPHSEPIDIPSVALSLGTILPLVYALTELARSGLAVVPVVALVIGLVVGVMFVYRQRALTNPLLDLRLFAIPAIGGGLVLYLLTGGANSGIGLLMIQHMQILEGYSPLKASLWLLVPSVVMIVSMSVWMGVAKHIKPGLILVGGALISAVGMIVLTRVQVGGFTVLIVGLCVAFIGVAGVPLLTNQMVLIAAPAEKAGSAGSLTTTAGDLGTALGIAVFGSLANIFYRGNVRIPAGVPHAASSSAKQSIASAYATARSLPSDLGQPLLAAARHAFNDAFTSVAAVCIGMFVALAVLNLITLRSVEPFGDVSPAGPVPRSAEGETLSASS